MPTLSMEGSVFQADSLTRKELVQFAPFAEHDNIIISPDNEVLTGVSEAIISFDASIPKSFMFHLQEGEVTLYLDLQNSPPSGSLYRSNHYFITSGTYILFGAINLRGAEVLGISATSLYDWVAGY